MQVVFTSNVSVQPKKISEILSRFDLVSLTFWTSSGGQR